MQPGDAFGLVALGGFLGAAARYVVGLATPGPPGTLPVNVLGSFVLGIVVARSLSNRTGLLVGVGGSLGAVARFRVDRALDGRRATATVNVVGSFLLGVVAAGDVASTTALLAGTGFCGAFTTYSSFAVELGSLAADGDVGGSGRFGIWTLVAAVAAVLLGGVVGGLVT